MSTINPDKSTQMAVNAADAWGDGAQESEFKPLTRQEAQLWRSSQPAFSIWRLVGWQLLAGLLAGGLAWLLTQSVAIASSVVYGAAAVVLPTALMAYGLTSSALACLMSRFAQAAFAGFLFWEGVKVLLAVALLGLAPVLVPELNWLGLLAGLVVVLKVYWLGFLIQGRR
jgi:ATP synthase protein I